MYMYIYVYVYIYRYKDNIYDRIIKFLQLFILLKSNKEK
jgi:hypothetical protein